MGKNTKKKSEQTIINQFFAIRKKGLRNPLVFHFLKNEENRQLVEQAILDPTKNNIDAVEDVFQDHYETIVKTKYISNLIHFFSIDYDKKVRREKNRFTLTLDEELSEEDTTFKDMLKSDHKVDDDLYDSLFEFTNNELFIKGLKTLTKNQLLILDLIYLQELKLKEIAYIYDTTPQNISNQHRKALNTLYNFMKNGAEKRNGET